jgi:hypothetical protein
VPVYDQTGRFVQHQQELILKNDVTWVQLESHTLGVGFSSMTKSTLA